MGDHAAGRAIVQTAETLAASDKINLTALEILDLACEPYKKRSADRFGWDAEFDDATDPQRPFGKLLQKAFDSEGKYDPEADPDGEIWSEQIEAKFRARYGFC